MTILQRIPASQEIWNRNIINKIVIVINVSIAMITKRMIIVVIVIIISFVMILFSMVKSWQAAIRLPVSRRFFLIACPPCYSFEQKGFNI